MEKIKWSEKVTNEEVLEHTGEKRVVLNKSCIKRQLHWIYSMEELPSSLCH
jgi:hypothetical protein